MNEHSLWAEKYRPKKLEDFIIPEDLREKIEQWVIEKDIPHLLLAGSPGTGKTSLAYYLRDNISNEDNTLTINASSENSVDVIRNKIQNFSMGVSFGGQKICVMDESDALSVSAQKIMRNLMESYSKNTRFILTCNYPDKIEPAIKSRCQEFYFKTFSRTHIIKFLATIMLKEGIEGTAEQLSLIADSHGSDIRKAINTLQFNSVKGKLTINKQQLMDEDYKFKLPNLIKQKKLSEISIIIDEHMVKDFTPLYSFLYDQAEEEFTKWEDVMLILAEYHYQDAIVADRSLNFRACCLKIMKDAL